MYKLILFYFIFISSLFAFTTGKKNILVLESFHSTLPWTKEFNSGLEKSLIKYNDNIEFYIENLDYIRLGKISDSKAWLDFISKKYENIKFDGIILDSKNAKEVLASYNKTFFNNVPRVYNVPTNIAKKENVFNLELNSNESISNTIDLAIKFHPEIKNILVFLGKMEDSNHFIKLFPKKEKENPNIKWEIIKDFSLEELTNKVQNLKKETIIFNTLISRDKDGKKLIPIDILEKIIKNTNNPVYGFHSPLINTGIVGGDLVSGEQNAIAMVDALMDYIKNGKFKGNYNSTKLYINWDKIKYFNINEKLIPENAIILNKPKSIFEVFFYEVISIIFLIILLILLLTSLLILVYKLKAVNYKLSIEQKERKEKEELLTQQTKMALMGEMINNIAHQWRQPLSRINSNIAVVDLLLMKNKLDKSKIDSKLINIEEQTKYMSRTIDDFSSFFSPDKLKNVFCIESVIKKSMDLLSSRLKDVKVTYSSSIPIDINSYENEFSQVILAIVNNSLDNFKIKEIKKPEISVTLEKNDTFINIEILDNGGGIEPLIMNKIFEANFSTKKELKSSGLGLYISKNIIENSIGAIISVENKNNGVAFNIKIDEKELM